MGDGTGRRNFVKIAQELGISHRVHFTGMISNLDVHQNLINSAMHVVPSLAEPFGITAIESMLDGTPVIASNSGGLKEIVEDEKTGLFPSKGEYADGITVGHDNGIGMIHVYNPIEYGMKEFKGIDAKILSNVHIEDVKMIK